MRYKFFPSRDKEILELIKDKRVLHIGPCDWPYTKEKLETGTLLYKKIDEVCSKQIGIDLDKESILFLNKIGFKKSRIIFHDMNIEFKEDFLPEIVIFGETIEHLVNVGVALFNLKRFMTDESLLIITTPNAYSVGNFLNAVFGKEYQHPDHSVLFSRQVLIQMCEKNDLQVVSADFSALESHLSQKLNYKGKVVGWISRKIGYIFPMLAPSLFFVVKK